MVCVRDRPERVTGRSKNRPLSRLTLGNTRAGSSSSPAAASSSVRFRWYPVMWQSGLRSEEGSGGVAREGDERLEVRPCPGGAPALIEVRELRLQAEVRSAVPLRAVRSNDEPGELRVGPGFRLDRPIQGHEILEPQERVPSGAAPDRVEPAGEMRSAALRQARAQVLEILLVRHPLEAGIRRQPVRPVVAVHEIERGAVAVELRIVRQVLRREPAGSPGTREKAQLSLRLHAAIAHRSRGQRGVTVRRQVEVVGDRYLGAARAARAERRSEQSGLAPAAQRES